MKIKGRLNIQALVLGLMMFSCSLDIDETDSLITEGNSDVFNGVENVNAAIDNLYNNLSAGNPSQMNTQEELYALSEVTTDELIVPTRGTDWGDNGVWRTLHTHTWAPTHNFINQVWNNKNGAVLRATEIIDPLSNASAEQIAQAKFMRAYNMWVIMDCFGQVPFRNATDGPDVIPEVMSRQQAYDFVVKDLEEAIAALPASQPQSPTKTRAVKATARLLLARVKLNGEVYKGSYGENDLQDVIDLVNEIEAEGYGLESNYFEIFKGPTFESKDVVWALSTDVGSKMWNSLHYNQQELIPNFDKASVNSGGGWNGFATLSEFYDKFEGPTDNNSLGAGQEERRGYTQTLESTNADNEGFGYGFQLGQMYGWREGKAVALTTRTNEPLIFTKEFPGLIGNNEVTGMRLLKYSPANGAYTSGTVIFRFADAHLMRAEAMYRKKDVGAALIEVNKLRAMRANTPPLASLDDATLLDERGRELYLEYIRRTDMIRFGVFKNARGFKQAGDGHTDLFPIPASALLSNPNLSPNPGY
ncbi:RagB/SusD family nutrient uptake outer membrane protein [Chryseosolibacter indicus]|uniref:RagB/SusD family nutrient uptake outer membrane protein n=1 Tax=Chryseosolibacter indicus TaxID=2782351 RepID=A0ABS5VQQ7_9BACT|nr:RagB/SusD family nutrient uptake outer membrane protein [Chryseosolibacter indicus]MBT1703481.1 RagB/SusD family nutrient uptake outer membrane protein [Chryseosolibacter indicus]